MNPEIIMLSEVNQTQKDKYHIIFLLVIFLSLGRNIGHPQFKEEEAYFGLQFRTVFGWVQGRNGTMVGFLEEN